MSAVFHRLHGFIDRSVSGHHDYGHVAIRVARRAQYIQTRTMRHAQISQHNLVRNAANLIDSLARIGGFGDRIAGVLQRQPQHAAQAFFVFDEKNVRHEVGTAGGGWRVVGTMSAAAFIIHGDSRSVKQKNC